MTEDELIHPPSFVEMQIGRRKPVKVRFRGTYGNLLDVLTENQIDLDSNETLKNTGYSAYYCFVCKNKAYAAISPAAENLKLYSPLELRSFLISAVKYFRDLDWIGAEKPCSNEPLQIVTVHVLSKKHKDSKFFKSCENFAQSENFIFRW